MPVYKEIFQYQNKWFSILIIFLGFLIIGSTKNYGNMKVSLRSLKGLIVKEIQSIMESNIGSI